MIDPETAPIGGTVWFVEDGQDEACEVRLICTYQIDETLYEHTIRFPDSRERSAVHTHELHLTRPPVEDPYLNQHRCVQRLLKEWRKHGRLIVAVDFDDSVWPFHDTNHTHDKVIALVKECSDLGCLIVIYTASDPSRYPMMRAFLEGRGIKVASVNENPIELPFGRWGKIYYNAFLDDRAGLASAYEQLRQVVYLVKREKGLTSPPNPA